MNTDNDTVYRQIQQEVEQAAQGLGVDCHLSGDMAAAITYRLQMLFGSTTVYFPLFTSKKERYAAIKRDFNGVDNHDEVCKKHGISRRTLYRAVGNKSATKPTRSNNP